ncbi:MAG: AraC family transcriptional regulator [Desulfovibrionaceae bacterium]|jgi:AraC-like DNA-binding protein|nr:AraC family transcriptional regulator [Desulfovibrionaceae bacterium]
MGGVRKRTGEVDFRRDEELGLEVRFARYRGHLFPPHTHPDWSVGCIDRGEVDFVLAGEVHAARAGDVAVIPPGVVHACNPADGEWTYRMCYVDAAWMAQLALQALPGPAGAVAPAEAVASGGAVAPAAVLPPVIRDPELFDALGRLHALMADAADLLERQTAMTEAFGLLLARHAVPDGGACGVGGPCGGAPDADGEAGPHPGVAAARALLEERACEKVALEELARAAGLSPTHLLRVFRAAVGLTPHAYQTQLRIRRARDLLAQGAPIADVAAATGFTDQSVFSRTFRRFTGATPGQYRTACARR